MAAASAAAVLVVTTAGANINLVFVTTMGNMPVVGSLVKVLTSREYTTDDGIYHVNTKTPAVKGLKSNEPLKNSLDQKCMEENKKLHEQFEAEVAELKKNGDGHLGVDSGYEVECNDDVILSTDRYAVDTVGSSSAAMKYGTIDKKNQVFITLPSPFKDEQHVEVISKDTRQQMIDQNKADPGEIYWVEGIDAGEGTELFQNISAEQNFYINTNHELVASLNKYEAVPGHMGIIDFVIPIDLTRGLLVGNDYIR